MALLGECDRAGRDNLEPCVRTVSITSSTVGEVGGTDVKSNLPASVVGTVAFATRTVACLVLVNVQVIWSPAAHADASRGISGAGLPSRLLRCIDACERRLYSSPACAGVTGFRDCH